MTDTEFITQFETLKTPPEDFHHKAHLRYAYLCLQNATVDTAIQRVSRNISAYATHLGVADKYHQTITKTLMTLIESRREQNETWEMFLEKNTDLVTDARTVLLTYYSEDRLFSDEAKQAFLEPDLKPLPTVLV